jgi:hypothetical protein
MRMVSTLEKMRVMKEQCITLLVESI